MCCSLPSSVPPSSVPPSSVPPSSVPPSILRYILCGVSHPSSFHIIISHVHTDLRFHGCTLVDSNRVARSACGIVFIPLMNHPLIPLQCPSIRLIDTPNITFFGGGDQRPPFIRNVEVNELN